MNPNALTIINNVLLILIISTKKAPQMQDFKEYYEIAKIFTC